MFLSKGIPGFGLRVLEKGSCQMTFVIRMEKPEECLWYDYGGGGRLVVDADG